MKSIVGRVVTGLPDPVVGLLSKIKSQIVARRDHRFYLPLASDIFPTATDVDLLVSNPDAAVFRVQQKPGHSTILKLSRSPVADQLLAAESAALNELHGIVELGDWRSLLATVESTGTHPHGTWFTQSDLGGVTALQANADDSVVVGAALAALAPVHDATAQSVVVNESVLTELVSDPLALVAKWRPDQSEQVGIIERGLRQRLAGRKLVLARMHGDFAPTNVLWDPATDQVQGVIDWKFGHELAPPEIDLLHFPISLLMDRLHVEYGTTVIRLLNNNAPADLQALVEQARVAGPNGLDHGTAVTLAWLQHVAFGLHKAPDLRVNPIWLRNNIDSVIDQLATINAD